METAGTVVVGVMLLVLLAFIGLGMVSMVFHMRYRVPFVPTPGRVIDAMVKAAELKGGEKVLDLGAGDGRILAAALRRQPDIRAVGYEGSLGVWMLAQARNLVLKHKPDIRRENFFTADLSDADVIFTYLSVSTMQKLKPKFERELRPGTRVISHAFSLHGREPVKTHVVTMPFWGKTHVLEYHF